MLQAGEVWRFSCISCWVAARVARLINICEKLGPPHAETPSARNSAWLATARCLSAFAASVARAAISRDDVDSVSNRFEPQPAQDDMVTHVIGPVTIMIRQALRTVLRRSGGHGAPAAHGHGAGAKAAHEAGHGHGGHGHGEPQAVSWLFGGPVRAAAAARL